MDGDNTSKKLHALLDNEDNSPYQMQLQLAAMFDMKVLVKTTYELEGDRLARGSLGL